MSTEQASETKPRILVVDDSRVIRVAARKILKEEFEPIEAGDGEEAWEALTKEGSNIALVISDLSMPYLDGMGLLERIRTAEDANLRSLPMIIVTGAEDDDGAKTKAFAAGATDFISKPFDSVQLLAHTRSHIRLKKTEQELKEASTTLKEKPATDPFTGLANQHAFLEGGKQGLAYAIRHNTQYAVLMFQVDKFDHIFVHHGKPVGGAILKLVTSALQAEIRREDIAARISMARFGLLLPSSSADGARRLAERVCSRVGNTRVKGKDGTLFSISLSAGIAPPTVTRDMCFEDLLTDALQRLGQAMEQGGSVVAGPIPPPTEAVTEPATAKEPEAVAAAATHAVEEQPAIPASEPVIAQARADASPTATEAAPSVTEPVASVADATAATPEAEAGAKEVLSAQSVAPTLDQALAQLANNQGYALYPHLKTLIESLLPLLEHWNLSDQRGLDDAIARIRASLESK